MDNYGRSEGEDGVHATRSEQEKRSIRWGVKDELSDKEWAAAGGFKVGKDFPVMENVHRNSIGLLNDPTWQTDPERVMLEQVLKERIDDAMGRGRYHKLVCDECHFDMLMCGCHTIRLDHQPIIRRESRSMAVAHINGAYRIFPVDRLGQFDDGYWYWRGIVSKCKNAPTYQRCALDWFGLGRFPVAKECISTCDELGIELTGLQKYITKGMR